MDAKLAPTKASAMANGEAAGAPKSFKRSNSLQDKTPAHSKPGAAAATARRLRSISISEPQPTKAQPKFSKNSRKSRSGFGRGLPKKGGAGGKGVWGKPGSELDGVATAVDSHDPNYDSEAMDDDVELEPVAVQLTADEVKRLAETLVLEYFDHGDTSEVDRALTESWDVISIKLRYLVVVAMVELAMDHKASHREMTSVLISDLYQECLTQTDICRGFEALLEQLPELVLDCPDAPEILGNFMARCIADDCLPPKYLSGHKGKVECRLAIKALDRADLLVSSPQGMSRLDNVWGTGGARRPVRALVSQMVQLLQEYLSSADCDEAIRCLKELEVPHFHHELVYEAVTMAIERSDRRSTDEMVRLLKTMYGACVLTTNQMDEGFLRVYEAMPDTQLDVPEAYTLLERIVTLAFQKGVISRDTMRRMPTKGRKRFVSEGDGGRIKVREAPGLVF
ncbi:Programmed cell death protein 4 [Amphibalanus amphitrite]|uniref:Programmed cell death protein 4 n=1 Tax=Amphibalanus amphitrite TaxID=1232801 RepID=A0A6A4WB63_AMPAM|nr:Programmed cell death protein 4 [Amphibalanus amphitrite]KAF0303826.1 Programmed cell death protein 4 [Amphibalanus amphitrite]